MQETLMDNGTTQLLYTVGLMVIGVIVSVVGYYAKKLLMTNKYAVEYNLANERTERVLENALMYAESQLKKGLAENLTKAQLANSYIDKIAPDIIATEGAKLDLMLDRKLEQLLASGKINILPTSTEETK